MHIYLFILELHSAYQEVFIQLLEYLILMLVDFPPLWTFESVFSYLVQSILLVTLMFTDCSNKQTAAMKEYQSLLLPCSHGHDLSSHNVPTFTISSRIYSENGFQIYRKEREMDAMNFRDAAARSRAVKLVLMSHILQNCFHEQQNWAQITFICGTLRRSAPRQCNMFVTRAAASLYAGRGFVVLTFCLHCRNNNNQEDAVTLQWKHHCIVFSSLFLLIIIRDHL